MNGDQLKRARELLGLTQAELARQEMVPPITLSTLAELKLRWGVSMQFLITRPLELEIIDRSQALSLRTQISKRSWRKREPASLWIEPEKPRGLRKMAEILYANPIPYKRMADDLHIPVFLIKRILEMYAGQDAFVKRKLTSQSERDEFIILHEEEP
jgi:transcriptional regulator with XRE-family HTH domain